MKEPSQDTRENASKLMNTARSRAIDKIINKKKDPTPPPTSGEVVDTIESKTRSMVKAI